MLRATLSILQLPGRATRRALTTATSPGAINTLSTAIAQGSIQTANSDQDISIEGLDVDIQYNQSRLLTTGGIAGAIAYGTVYWLGTKLKVQYRYASMITALEGLDQALKSNDIQAVEESLSLIDTLSDPLIDPQTLEPIESADEVKKVFEQVMKQPAEPGTMFNAGKLTSSVDEAVKVGERATLLLANESVEEGIEAMTKKAVPIAKTGLTRTVGAILWIDTVYWLGTSALDVGLNYLGIPEDKQKIPFLSDLPGIGSLFDLSDGLGASAVDLVITAIFEGTFSLLGLDDVKESLVETLWGIILSASLNPTITPFIIAILDFYIDNIEFNINIDVLFPIDIFKTDIQIDMFKVFRPEPLDILVIWLYLIVGKIIFKAWVVPTFRMIKQ